MSFPVFDVYPEIKRIGQAKLQELCDCWISTPLAREFAVSKVTVELVNGRLRFSPEMKMTHAVKNGEAYYFPTDELLFYVADNGIDDLSERDAIKAKVVANRQRCGPDVYRRFTLTPGPKLPIFITCKNPACADVMMTQLTAYRCERQEWDLEPIECPRCRQSFKYDGVIFTSAQTNNLLWPIGFTKLSKAVCQPNCYACDWKTQPSVRLWGRASCNGVQIRALKSRL